MRQTHSGYSATRAACFAGVRMCSGLHSLCAELGRHPLTSLSATQGDMAIMFAVAKPPKECPADTADAAAAIFSALVRRLLPDYNGYPPPPHTHTHTHMRALALTHPLPPPAVERSITLPVWPCLTGTDSRL